MDEGHGGRVVTDLLDKPNTSFFISSNLYKYQNLLLYYGLNRVIFLKRQFLNAYNSAILKDI